MSTPKLTFSLSPNHEMDTNAPPNKKRSNIQAFPEKRAAPLPGIGRFKVNLNLHNSTPKNSNLLHPSSAEGIARSRDGDEGTSMRHSKKRRHNIDGDSEVPDSTGETTSANSSFNSPAILEQALPTRAALKLHTWKHRHVRTPSNLSNASSAATTSPLPSYIEHKEQPGYITGQQAYFAHAINENYFKTKTSPPQPIPKEHEEVDTSKYPHLYFAYGTDMSTHFLESLCEAAAQAAKKKDTAGADTVIVLDSVESPVDRPPRGLRKREVRSQNWSEQYKLVGLGKLTGYTWLIDESGHAKIIPSPSTMLAQKATRSKSLLSTFNPIHGPRAFVPGGAKSSNKRPPPRTTDTSAWRPQDWDSWYNPRYPNKPVPTGTECAKWTQRVWDTYLGFPAAEQKLIPPFESTKGWSEGMWVRYLMQPIPVLAPRLGMASTSTSTSTSSASLSVEAVNKVPVVEKKEEKEDVVYGIVYHLSPFLFTLLSNHQLSLPSPSSSSQNLSSHSPSRRLIRTTISHQTRIPSAQPFDWYAPIHHIASLSVDVWVGDGIGGGGAMTKAEKEKKGRDVILGDMERKVKFNRAVLDLKSLACPSVWLDGVVRQYVPRPKTMEESGCWY